MLISVMALYQSIQLAFTLPDSGKVVTLNAFAEAGFSHEEFNKLISNEEVSLPEIISSFKISQPVDLPDLAGYDGFSDFISALEAEEP